MFLVAPRHRRPAAPPPAGRIAAGRSQRILKRLEQASEAGSVASAQMARVLDREVRMPRDARVRWACVWRPGQLTW